MNVLLRAPFNLRNEPSSSQANVSSSRSGRSPSSNYNRLYNRNLDFNEGDLSQNSSPKASPPKSRSESNSSLRQGSLSHASATEDIPYDREPILKARLVGTSKGAPRVFNRRGRSRTRSTRLITDTTSEGLPTLEGIQSVDSGRINVTNPLGNGNSSKEAFPSGSSAEAIDPLNEDEDATVCTATKFHCATSLIITQILAISEELSKSLENSLNLEDIGALSRGWGD